jgi:hypothetical protein
MHTHTHTQYILEYNTQVIHKWGIMCNKIVKIVSVHAESGKTEVLLEARVYGYLCF